MNTTIMSDFDKAESHAPEAGGTDELQQILRALRLSAALLLICGAVWLAAFWTNRQLYYIRPGSEIMYNAKAEVLYKGTPLDMSKPVRVLVIGNSKVMAGFVPALFEREVPRSSAYNCGQPNTTVFVDQLAELFKRGQVPTHVLFAIEWKDAPTTPRTFFRFTGSDQAIMDDLFPFRHLVRNGAVFLLRSRQFGGPKSSYRQAQEQEAQMRHDRGYYFISDQSRFPNRQLPADFKLDSDDPEHSMYRSPGVTSQSFQELHELAVRYGIKILVVPYYLRKGERAAPGINREMVQALRPYSEFRVVGDEYLLYDNRYFSDIAHLNPDGARLYTGYLADAVNRELATERGKDAF